MTIDLVALAAPYPAAEIEWRVGSTNKDKTSGLALAYLTARHVMDRLDEVCGPANWSDRYEFHGSRTVCYLSIRIDGEWVTKADGAGDSDVEAEKGAISDALKRAAVKWGIGRYLYDLGNIWVDLEDAGRSVRIKKDQYRKLQSALDKQFGSAVSAREPAEGNAQPAPLEKHLANIKGAETLADLQSAFKAGWTAITDDVHRAKLKAAYDTLKSKLTPADDFPGDQKDAA